MCCVNTTTRTTLTLPHTRRVILNSYLLKLQYMRILCWICLYMTTFTLLMESKVMKIFESYSITCVYIIKIHAHYAIPHCYYCSTHWYFHIILLLLLLVHTKRYVVFNFWLFRHIKTIVENDFACQKLNGNISV